MALLITPCSHSSTYPISVADGVNEMFARYCEISHKLTSPRLLPDVSGKFSVSTLLKGEEHEAAQS
jgi:ribosomal protein RSM22 (predicted rRNA methylase)